MYIHNYSKYDPSGRKRKTKKPKGEVYAKYKAPAFKPLTSTPTSPYAESRLSENRRYPSVSDFNGPGAGRGTSKESPKYTGDYVIGVATLHKSNAVPVTNKKYATEISEMIK